jgi:hypothetical protein
MRNVRKKSSDWDVATFCTIDLLNRHGFAAVIPSGADGEGPHIKVFDHTIKTMCATARL